jgi:hypothetical protein
MSQDESIPDAGARPDDCHLFVDEAGTPDIFDSKGRNNVGTGSCSRFFLLGMLEVDEPEPLASALTALRQSMLADPYFASAESFKPERKKTALLFHAKDDLPDVRVKVFDLLRSSGPALRFRAVVCDKDRIRVREEAKRAKTPGYRYRPDDLYDELARSLFGKFTRSADRFRVWIAKRGNKNRNAAIRTAIAHAERDFESRFGFSRGGPNTWDPVITDPRETVCLQACDYFLWALQRFYEPRTHQETGEVIHEERYLNALWPQISQVYDMHFGPPHGSFFTPSQPVNAIDRFGPKPAKKKRP